MLVGGFRVKRDILYKLIMVHLCVMNSGHPVYTDLGTFMPNGHSSVVFRANKHETL